VSGDPSVNAALIKRLYDAFARHDGARMAECYAKDAHFHDPVFEDLHGEEIGSMWTMLCSRATDLRITHSRIEAGPENGSAHWEADYTFNTGRLVHNPIDATFKFKNGLIADHRDDFSLYAWARQALGPVGILFGWSPPIQGRIRTQAREGLDEFMAGGAATGAPG